MLVTWVPMAIIGGVVLPWIRIAGGCGRIGRLSGDGGGRLAGGIVWCRSVVPVLMARMPMPIVGGVVLPRIRVVGGRGACLGVERRGCLSGRVFRGRSIVPMLMTWVPMPVIGGVIFPGGGQLAGGALALLRPHPGDFDRIAIGIEGRRFSVVPMLVIRVPVLVGFGVVFPCFGGGGDFVVVVVVIIGGAKEVGSDGTAGQQEYGAKCQASLIALKEWQLILECHLSGTTLLMLLAAATWTRLIPPDLVW